MNNTDWSQFKPLDGESAQPSSTDWSQFKPIEAATTQKKPEGFVENAVQGFKRSLPETKSLLVGAGAAVAGAVGANETRDSLLETYQEIDKAEVQPLASDTSFTGVLSGEDSFTDWAGDTLGNFGGQALQSVAAGVGAAAIGSAVGPQGTAAGAVAGVLGKGAVKKVVGDKVGDMLKEQAAKRFGKAKLGTVIGGAAAPTAMNIGQEVGIGFTDRATDAAAANEQLNQADSLRAIGWGVPAGLLDTATEVFLAGKLFSGASADPRFIKRMLAGAAKGAMVEGGTEGAQAFLERLGAKRDVATQEAFLDYVNNAAAGALGGGVAGGAGGFKRQEPDSPAGNTQNTNNTQTPPPVPLDGINPADGPVSTVAAASNQEAPPSDLLDPNTPPISTVAGVTDANDEERQAGLLALLDQHEEEQSRLYGIAEMLGLDPQDVVNNDSSALGELSTMDDQTMAAYAAKLGGIPEENIPNLIAQFAPSAQPETAPAETAVPEPVSSAGSGQETPSGQTTDAETALTDEKPGIKWDRTSQIGGVPDQSNLDYMGFERNMKPSEFRSYVPEGVSNPETKDFILGAASRGESVAPPFLKAEWDKDNKVWNVQNHEGRSRTDAALELNPDQDMPVSILPTLPRGELRARDITDEMRNAPIVGQIGSPANPKPVAQEPAAPDIDAAAATAATSDQNDLPQPTDAQKEAGNYKKGHVVVNGLDISIENPAGSQRDPKWPALANHYGYIKGTVGKDKDHVDVFMTDKAADPNLPVFVVDQMVDGKFDEHKVVMGAATEAEAREAYKSNYSKDWKGDGVITQMTQEEFKAWVRDPNKTKKPAAESGPARDFAEVTDSAGNVYRVRQKHLDNPKIDKLPTYDANGKRVPNDKGVNRADLAQADSEIDTLIKEFSEATEPDAPEDKYAPKYTDKGVIDTQDEGNQEAYYKPGNVIPRYTPFGESQKYAKVIAFERTDDGDFNVTVINLDDEGSPIAGSESTFRNQLPKTEEMQSVIGTDPQETAAAPDPKPPVRKLTKEEVTAEMDRVREVLTSNEDNVGKDLEALTEAVKAEADTAMPKGKIDQLAKQVAKFFKEKAKADAAPDPAILAAAIDKYFAAAGEGVNREQFEAGFNHAMAGKTRSTLPEGADYLTGYQSGFRYAKTAEGRRFYTGETTKKLEGDAEFDLKRIMDGKRKQDAGKSDAEVLLEALKEEATRAKLFPIEEVEGESPGRAAALEYIRSNIRTLADHIETMSFFGPFVGNNSYNGNEFVLRVSKGYRQSQSQAIADYIDMGVFNKNNDIFVVEMEEDNKNRFERREDQSTDSRYEALLSFRVRPYIRGVRGYFDAVKDAKTASEVFAAFDEYRAKVMEQNNSDASVWTGMNFLKDNRDAKKIIENDFNEGAQGKQLRRPKLDSITRTGMGDSRGRRDVVPSEFTTTFDFGGTDFGDWVSGMEGQDNINYAYDAFSDLASLLNMPNSVIGSGSGMYFTIGKLGSGRHAAHFSKAHPIGLLGSVPVINITKTKGDGTIAHEWGHALDLMMFTGDWNSLRRRFLKHFRKRPPTVQEVEDKVSRFLRGRSYITSLKGNPVASTRRMLQSWEDFSERRGARYQSYDLDSFYYKESLEADKGRSPAYWSNDAEMFTRAFEAYIYDKLVAKGAENNFLVNGWVADGAVTKEKGYKAAIYPMGEDRKEYNRWFDALFKAARIENGKPFVSAADFDTALSETEAGKAYEGNALIQKLLMPGVLEERYKQEMAKQEAEQVEREKLRNDREKAEQEKKQDEEVGKLFSEESLKDPSSRRVAAANLARVMMGGRKMNILDVRKMISSDPVEPGTPYAKMIEETTEMAVVFASRMTIDAGRRANKSNAEIFDDLVTLYNNQPNLNTRTSESMIGQMYSTPAPMAFAASFLAGIDQRTTVLEPTAGNGMLLIEAVPGLSTVNEMDQVRYENLTQMSFRTTQDNAAKVPFATQSVDVVIANPPFGRTVDKETFEPNVPGGYPTDQLDHAISLAALDAMKDGGRAVLIVGSATGNSPDEVQKSYNSSTKRNFYASLYQAYNVVEHLRIDGKLYGRQGASFPVDMIVIEGRGKSQLPLPGFKVPTNIDTFNQLKEIISGRNRVAPASIGTPMGVGSGDGGRGRDSDAGNVDRTPGESGTGPVVQSPESGQGSGATQGGQGPTDGPGVPGSGVRGRDPGGRERAPTERASGDGRQPVAADGNAQPGNGNGNGRVPGTGQSGIVGQPRSGVPGRVTTVTNKTDDNPVTTERAQTALERLQAAAALRNQGKFSQPDPGADLELDKLDEELRQDFIDLSLNAIHDGARKFSDFVIRMTEYGLDAFKQFFKALYKYVTGKNSYDDVDTVEAVDNTETDAIIAQAWESWQQEQNERTQSAGLEVEKTQVEYFPGSKNVGTGALVPAGIADAIHQSLAKLDDAVGGIDKYVGTKLGYTPAELGVYFSAEQVDAVALAIYAYENGRGFIIGDQTGIGKGRVNAAMIRYALRNGLTPVFVTEKPNLYTDMIRDLDDIGMSDELGLRTNNQRIVMTNGGESYPYKLVSFDADGEPVEYEGVLKPKKSVDEIKVALNDVASGKKANIVFSTYDQNSQSGWRRDFLKGVMGNAFLIVDESHNAGGTENKFKAKTDKVNRADFFRGLVRSAKGTFFSSATYAKRPSVMDLYSTTNMMLAVDEPSKLAEAILSGGIPMQQAVAFMLAKDGQYIRRERSFDGIKYETQRHAVDIAVADDIATSMREIYDFSLLRSDVIKKIAAEMKAIGGDTADTDKVGVDGVDFSGVMHTVVKQSLLALKAKATVDYVVKRVKGELVDENGNKNRPERVVVTVSSTMGALIQEIKEAGKLNAGDAIDLRMNDVYLRYLERQRIIKYRYPKHRKDDIPPAWRESAYLNDKKDTWIVERRLTDDQLGPTLSSMFYRIKDEINQIDFGSDTPASPIDYMHRLFSDAGVKSDEITGRNHTIRYGEIVDGKRTATYEPRSSTIKARLKAIDGFNNQDTQVLIINQSGSTGLSLHAAPKFKNQQPRHMVVAQPEDNIDTHMQLLGRINRTGQVETPAYTQFMADIPAEMRPAAILAKKMASLNANTTGGKKTDVQSSDIVDFMNDYGGQVAYEFLEDNRDILTMLGGAAAKIAPDEDGSPDETVIRKLTGRIALLPVATQERVYDELTARYNALIAMHNAQGTNNLEARAIDFRAKTIERFNVTDGVEGSDSEFAKPSVLETIMGQQVFKPLTDSEIDSMVKANLDSFTPEELSESLRKEMKDYTESLVAAITEKYNTDLAKLPEDDADGRDKLRTYTNARIAKLRLEESELSKNLGLVRQIGKTIELKDQRGNMVWGVITGVKGNPKATNRLAPSTWEVSIALINGESRSVNIPFSKLQSSTYAIELAPTIKWKDEVTGLDIYINPRELLTRMSHSREVKRYIATGNLLAAKAELSEGQIIRFTREDGTIDQGILLPSSWNAEDYMRKRPIKLNDAQRIEFLKTVGGAVYANTEVSVSAYGKYYNRPDLFFVTVSVPSSKKVGAMTDPELIKILGSLTSARRGEPAIKRLLVIPDGSNEDGGGYRTITHGGLNALIKYLAKFGGQLEVVGNPQGAKDILDRDKPRVEGSFSKPLARRRRAGLTAAAVKAELGDMAKRDNVFVVQSAEDLPLSAKLDPSYVTADGFYDGQNVYIVADNLSSMNRARVVLAHELIGHYGMEAITGQALWDQIDSTIANMEKNPAFNALFAEIKRRYPGADRNLFMKEAIAVMAEKGVRNSVIDRIIAAVRKFIRGLGFNVALNDAEIRSMVPALIREQLSRAERFVRTGQSPTLAPAAAFSKDIVLDPNSGKQRKLTDRFIDKYGTQPVAGFSGADALGDGHRVFVYHEMDEKFFEVTQVSVLDGYDEEQTRIVDKAYFVSKDAPADDNNEPMTPYQRAAVVLSKGVSEFEPAFQTKKSDATTLPAVVQDIGKGEFKVAKRGTANVAFTDNEDDTVPAEKWSFTAANGNTAYVYVETNGDRMYLDAAEFDSGVNGGAKLYSALFNYAFNTGKVLIGDPSGLSEEALYRRTEMMLSAAIKFGSTRMMVPHPRQQDPLNSEYGTAQKWVFPLQWKVGDDKFNIAALVEASYNNNKALLGSTDGESAVYHSERRRYESGSGKPLSNNELGRIAGQASAVFGRYKEPTNRSPQAAVVGRNSVKRALYIGSLLSTEGAVRGATDLVQLAGKPAAERLNHPLVDTFYSQPGAPAQSGVLSEQGSVKEYLGNKLTDIKPGVLGLIPMNYLTDFAHKKMGAIQNYIDARYAMETMRNNMHQKYDEVAQRWLAFSSSDKKGAQDLADLMHETTIAGIDPTADRDSYKEPLQQEWDDFHFRYTSLPEEGQKLYNEARDSYTAQVKLLESTLADNFERAVSITINRSERQMNKRVREIEEDGTINDADQERMINEVMAAHESRVKDARRNAKSRGAALRMQFEKMRVNAPYFPLARFGTYSVAVKKNGKIVSFSKFETMGEAKAFEKQMIIEGYEVKLWLDSEKNDIRGTIDPTFLADIDEILTNNNPVYAESDSEALVKAKQDQEAMLNLVRDAVYQRYLESLPDMSMRKSFIHRKKTAGFSNDALRAYSSTLFHGSYQIARLRYGMEMGEYLEIAQEQAIEHDPVQGMALVNEMRKRHEWVMNPKGSAAAQIATTGAFVYYLGANPAHLFLNATQTAMVGIPVLGSKYGFVNTMKHLWDATRMFFDTGGDIMKGLSGDELAAMKEFEKTGLLDKTSAHDLAGVGETGVEYSALRQKWMSKISWFFHKSEVFNREVTALAAYRLAREATNPNGSPRYGHSAAVRTARKQTYEIHFDYSNANRPRYMQSDAAKILLVFRNYNINILYRLFRDINDSLRGQSPQAKAEARKQLGAMMGMYSLMAGVAGVPFYGLAMGIAGAFDDDDEPFTFEERMKQGLVEYLGEDMARLVISGVPGTALGIDLRERIGLPNLWFRSPDRELEGRDYYYYWMEQLLGANAGIAKSMIVGGNQVWNGLKEMNGGDVQRGVESMLPAAAKSVVKAGRYAVTGEETNLDGDKIVDIGPGEVLARAIGFTPLDLAVQYDANNTLKRADAKLLKRRTALMNRYGLAITSGDREGARDALQVIMEFNRINPGYQITRGGLDRSLRQKARNDAQAMGGIVMNKRMQGLNDQIKGETE